MADVNQVPSCVGTVVVQEMYHCSTSARPSHGRSQPGWRWLSARSQACVRSRRAGTPPDAPLASPGSARQPLDLLSVAVWVAQFPVAWLLTPQLGESDTLPDDVPAIPPGLLQDFCRMGGRRGTTLLLPFFDPLPPNPSCTFQCNGLSSVILYVNGLRLSSHWSSIGHILVAHGAQHQRFAFPRRHDFDPSWFFSTVIGFEVFECSDVMHLNALCISCGATVFTGIGQQPLFQF